MYLVKLLSVNNPRKINLHPLFMSGRLTVVKIVHIIMLLTLKVLLRMIYIEIPVCLGFMKLSWPRGKSDVSV